MLTNPNAREFTHPIHYQDAQLLRFVIPAQRHTATIPAPMAIQIARPRNDRTPIHADHTPRDCSLQVHADAAFLVAGDILAVVVDSRGIDGSSFDDGTGAVGQGLVEFVDQVVVRVEADVLRFDAHFVAAAVDAQGGGGGR